MNRPRASFSRRLAWRIVQAVCTVMVILSVCIYKVVSVSMTKMESLLFTEVLRRTGETISKDLSIVSAGCINSLDKIESHLSTPDSLSVILRDVVSQNPDVVGCFVAFKENYYPQKGRWYEPYAYRDGPVIKDKQIGGPHHDYFSQTWYHQGLSDSESGWTDPYLDKDGGETIVTTFPLPVKDGSGQTVGVLGLDLSLYWLANIMRNTDAEINEIYKNPIVTTPHVYCFILNSDGTYVAHPDTSRILRDNFKAQAASTPDTSDDLLAIKMQKRQKGQAEAVIDGVRQVVFFSPVENTQWTLAVVVSEDLYHAAGRLVGIMLLALIAISLVVVFFDCVISIRLLTKPLVNFAASTHEIAKGNFQTSLPAVKRNDEIGLLHDSFRDMQQSLAQYVEKLKQTTASKAAIENELNIARSIQMSMIPKRYPPYPERNDIDIYGYMQPAKDVGGDLFDFFIRDNKLFFCIGDVSGKGVPAALLMTVARNLFRSVSVHEQDPGQIVTQMNKTMSEGNEANMFVTLFVGILNLATGRLSYCNAGHDAPLLIGFDVTELPVKPHAPVGLLADMMFETEEMTMPPMTTLFLFTDGLTEAARIGASDQEWELFGDERVMVTTRQAISQNLLQPQPFTENMRKVMASFVGDSEQSDDLTMLTIRYTP